MEEDEESKPIGSEETEEGTVDDQEEKTGYPDDVDFKKFLGCGG